MIDYNICFCADNNYSEQIGVAIVSILKNSEKDDTYNFYILVDNFEEENKKKIRELTKTKDCSIKYIKMNPDDFKKCPLLKEYNKDFKHYHVPISTYYRFKIASLFPKLDKILYLDCDIVVNSSLKELYQIDITNEYAAMVPDVETENESERLNLPIYCNAGVMMINLAKWREDSIESKLFEYAENNKDTILWQDQDVLNVVLQGKIKVLPRKWNFQFFQYDPSRYDGLYEKYYEYNILHFSGRYKPWNNETLHPLFQEYYSYLLLTPWKHSLVQYKKQAFEKFFKWDPKSTELYEQIIKATKYADEKVTEMHEQIIKATKYADEKVKEVITFTDEKITTNNTDLYRYAEHIAKTNMDQLQIEVDKIISFIDDKKAELKCEQDKATDEKLLTVYKEIEKAYKYTEEIVADKENQLLFKILEIDTKILTVESELKIGNSFEFHENNEKIKRLIDLKINDLRGFFEEVVKNQIEVAKTTYENLNSQQKNMFEQDLRNQSKYKDELMASRLESQKSWYENELSNQKQKFENEIQKQIVENNLHNTNILSEKLKEQQEFYIKEIESKKEYSNSRINELESLLAISQKSQTDTQEEVIALTNEVINLKRNLKDEQDSFSRMEMDDSQKAQEIERLTVIIAGDEKEKERLNAFIVNQEQENEREKERLYSLFAEQEQKNENENEKLNVLLSEREKEIESLKSILKENNQIQKVKQEEYEKTIKETKEYYELKIKPVAKLISLIDSKNKFLKK